MSTQLVRVAAIAALLGSVGQPAPFNRGDGLPRDDASKRRRDQERESAMLTRVEKAELKRARKRRRNLIQTKS